MHKYESPIQQVIREAARKHEENIYQAVLNCGIHVEKEELIKALAYDRDQYEKGYTDALASIVHCEDCQHLHKINGAEVYAVCPKSVLVFYSFGDMDARKHFCGFGIRRNEV